MTDENARTGGAVAGGQTMTASEPSKSDQAKQQAAETKDEARRQAGETVGTAKEQAGEVVQEAKSQARNVVREAQQVARTRADEQTSQLSTALRQVQQQTQALLDGRTDEAGPVGDYARQLTDAVGRYADRVEELGFDGIVRETSRFARRRPGAFLAMAAGAGLAVGRLGRGMKDASQDSGTAASRAAQTQLPATTPEPTTPDIDGPRTNPAGTAPVTGTVPPATGSAPQVPPPVADPVVEPSDERIR